MRLPDFLDHPVIHTALSNVGVDQHHIRPSTIAVVNTSQSVSPLPGGPGVWDIAVPLDAVAVLFHFRSAHTVGLAGASSGVTGLATRSSLDAATVSFGGHGTLGSTSYNATYAKAAAALNLSHKVFDTGGGNIALTDVYLTLTGPSTRVLRTQWTNYGVAFKTLSVHGDVGVLG